MKKKVFVLLTIFFIISISSCNFFIIPQHGRENSNDFQAQIYNLFAFQTGDSEVRVSFTWRDLIFNNDEDEKIEEAVLVYNVGEALPIRSIPLPPDTGGTVGFDFKDGVYEYSKIIDGLSEGDRVYFALYPRTKSRWLAPLYETVKVMDTADRPLVVSVPSEFIAVDGLQVKSNGEISEISGSYNIDNDVALEEFVIFRFDLPDRIFCTDARLNLPTLSATTGFAYPVVYPYFDHIDGNDISRLIDYSNGIPISFDDGIGSGGAGAGEADITDVVNSAILHQSNAIAIMASPGVSENGLSFGTEELTLEYQEY